MQNFLYGIDHGDNVFNDAIVESSTLILKNYKLDDNTVLAVKQRNGKDLISHFIDKKIWLNDELNRIIIELKTSNYELINKLEIKSKPFENSSEIIFGIKPYQVGHGFPAQTREMVNQRIYHSTSKIDEEWFPLVTGTDVNRYKLGFENEYILYGKNLMYPSNINKIKSNKILLRRTSHDLRAVLDKNNFYPQNSLFIITSNLNLEYLLCLINSKLFDFIYKSKCPQVGKVFAEVKPSIIKSLPIIEINESLQIPFIEQAQLIQSRNKDINELSQKFYRTLQRKFEGIEINKKLENWYELTFADFVKELGKKKIKLSLSEEAEWEDYFLQEQQKAVAIKNEIDATDKEIDRMVYELYGLSEEEIKIVEGS